MAKRDTESGENKPKINKEGFARLIGIFRFVKPYRSVLIIGIVCLMLSSITLLSFPYFAGKLLDVASGKGGFFLTSINHIALALIGILLVQSVFSFIRVYTFAIVSEKTLADIRLSLYEKMLWLPMKFFDERRVGELISRITSDVGTLQDTFTVTLSELLRQIVVLIAGTVVIFVLTPKLTLFMLLTFPLLVLAALFFGKFIRKLSKKTQDQLASANVIVEETLQSVSVVKAFTNELFETLRYKKSLKEVVRVALHASKYRGLFISFTILALFGGIVAVSWYGALLVQSGDVTVGELFSFVLYTTFIGGSIAGLGDIYGQLQKSIGASERVLEILSERDERGKVESELKLKGDIRFSNVDFAYPTRKDVGVLHQVSFHIAPGEKIALVGPSGSGKSTITSLLLRFYQGTKGSILVDETDINLYPLTGYRSNIAIVPQEVILFGGSIRENIAYGNPEASDKEIEEAATKANAMEFIQSFPEKLDTLVGDRGVKLSGGQRQRIAIARAILKDPKILILDEATSSLDAASERLVQHALERLMEGRTTIVIAHRLSTVRKVDRILVVNEGRIAESGTHYELSSLNNGIYSNLLKLQFETDEASTRTNIAG
ncbi:MAG TPA: ABC transporter transmembrane domain-containing protein [Cyclobacteriaceae bacterium]|nr:ABC transporter transmembrane domain-containing protein [Cyclobacteriaceae bacterium]HRW97984.1 ABC transporter transmembrane domain-containing protein [Cyclobacteriaceae bacterium]